MEDRDISIYTDIHDIIGNMNYICTLLNYKLASDVCMSYRLYICHSSSV